MTDFIKKYIRKDIKLKILSLILATMLWFAISHIGESKMSVSVHVSTNNLSKDFIVKKMDTDDVLVTINGPVSILKNVRARDIKVALDLSAVTEGRHIVNLQKSNVQLPKGIKVEDVKPDYIVMEVDRAMEKKLRTVVKLDKKWMNIYRVKSWYPYFVHVEGSVESLKDKNHIETMFVDGYFMNEEEELDVALDTQDMTVKKLKPETIRVILRRN